jgi:hypothetical protein
VRIIRWLAFSRRLLLLEEISEIIAIDPERDPMYDREEVLQDPMDVLAICPSLVTIFPQEKSVNDSFSESQSTDRFVIWAHYSVKEYLISERSREGQAGRYSVQEGSCNEFIAKSCIGYLLFFQRPNSVSDETLRAYRLLDYSARFWITHTQAVTQMSEPLNQLVMTFFLTGSGAYLNWIRIHDPDTPGLGPNWERKMETAPTPLYYASMSGFTEVVRLLILEGKDADVNTQQGRCGNALQVASAGGHSAVVELLLDRGADVNAQGGYYGNALQAASAGGHLALVELLLGKGADINAQGGCYGNALQAASEAGQLKILELLLSKGADKIFKSG